MVEWRWLAGAAAMALAGPVAAADKAPCPKDMVCASDPGGVAGAMMRSGYQAAMEKDAQGDPSIASAASGYKFDVYFYGCAEHAACDSLQFMASFSADPAHTLRFANEWNRTKRFGQMSVDDKGVMRLSHDVTTIGGLTLKNFGDQLDWWSVTLGELAAFMKAQAEPAKGVEPAS